LEKEFVLENFSFLDLCKFEDFFFKSPAFVTAAGVSLNLPNLKNPTKFTTDQQDLKMFYDANRTF